ncbi:hypothetical protein ACFLQJ_00060 [Calditrichota bacterium]
MKPYLILICMIFSTVIISLSANAQGGDLLNEAGIQAVPEGMTYEEYRDANRRLMPAVLMSTFLPVPGMMHFQAEEKRTGYYLLGAAGAGIVSIVAGIATASESDEYMDSDYATVDINNVRYEKIPVLIYDENGNENTAFHLKELSKKAEINGAGAALIVLGAGLIVADYVYDWWHGINVIQEKRDRVRYKYGKQIRFGMNPIYDPENGSAGVQLGFTF